MKDLFLVGGGGHCRSCIDVIEQEGKFRIKGIFDIRENVGNNVLGYKIIGSDEDILTHVLPNHFFLITIGQIKSAQLRVNIFEKLKNQKASFATVISPRAYVSPHAKLEEGTIVLHDVLINASVEVGVNCILNSKCLLEHDAKIGNHCHISTAAIVNGGCKIEDECFIGSNSIIKEGITVMPRSIISAGSFYRGK